MTRTIEGYGAAFSLDLGGDLIQPGAFTRTLAEWRAKKYPIPLLDMHDSSSIRKILGSLIDAKEDKQGLFCTFEVANDVDGDACFSKTQDGHVDGLSIGYRPVRWRDPGPEGRLRGIDRILDDVDLREISVVMWPMNTDARITRVSGPSAPRKISQREVDELQKKFNEFNGHMTMSRLPQLLRDSERESRRQAEAIKKAPQILASVQAALEEDRKRELRDQRREREKFERQKYSTTRSRR